MSREEFWHDWFGLLGGREIGSPYREYCPNASTFLSFLSACSKNRLPAFMSVQGYSDRNVPSVLEKLFFDFDCKENPEKAVSEAKDFAEKIQRFYGAKAFLVFSGAKGCHAYIWVQAVEFLPGQVILVKDALKRLQVKVLKGTNYSTVDPAVMGDLARLARVPYSLHDRSLRLCEPLDPSPDLDSYRENCLPRELLKTCLLEAKAAQEKRETGGSMLSSNARTCVRGQVGGVRRQIAALIEKAQRGEKLKHRERLAIVCELLASGKSDDEIVALFSKLVHGDDFNEVKTRYFVGHARRRGYRPFRLATLEAS